MTDREIQNQINKAYRHYSKKLAALKREQDRLDKAWVDQLAEFRKKCPHRKSTTSSGGPYQPWQRTCTICGTDMPNDE